MMAAQSVLGPKAAKIARKIPRIEPMLRMIEGCGFKVIGFEEGPITEKPVRMVHTSVGSMVFYQLLKRRGYTIALSDPPEKTGEAGEPSEPAFGEAASV